MLKRLVVTMAAAVLISAVGPVLAAGNADCLGCHGVEGFSKTTPAGKQVSLHVREAELKSSTHGELACVDCHSDLAGQSLPHKANVAPVQCGMCHGDVWDQYKESVHGKARARGVKDAPVCKDCHGTHNIQKPTSRASSVYPTNVAETCSRCHENVRLQKQYGLPGNRLASYIGSFHGVASKYGETTVANCATCHGPHEILPSSDPRSSINKANIPKTCGKCHPGASANFAKGDIHIVPTRTNDRLIYWVKTIYSLFVFGMIASFIGYIGLDLLYRARRRRNGS